MHWRKVWGSAALASLMLLAPASASAATVHSATLFDEVHAYGDWAAAPDANYLISGSAHDVTVFVREGDGGYWRFTFAAPQPDALKRGVYDRAKRYEDAAHPGLSVSRPYNGCNGSDGRFEIKDLAVGPDGVPTRLWAVFEYQCEERYWPEFGEIRFGVPRPDGAAYAVPAVQRWSAWDFGRPRADVPVTIRAASPVQLGSARITGADAAAFSIVSDACSGRALAAGESCEVLTRFRAPAPGARTATLTVGPASSTLQGFNYGGRTQLDITGQPVDEDDPPVWGTFTPPDSHFDVGGLVSAAGFYVAGRGGGWNGGFRAANGDPLVPGRYTGVQDNMKLPSPQPEPGMSITTGKGYAGPCSNEVREFTVTDITRYPDGETKSFGVDFERRCTSPPAIQVAGTFSFRVGDTTPLAPWMSGTPAGVPSPAPGDRAGGPPVRASWRCAGRVGVRGTRRGNRLRGTRRADRILAGRGNDRISAGRGSDCVSGGPGRDRIAGGPGADLLLGGSGRDVVIAGPGRDRVDCGPGRDTAYVGRGDRTRHCERVRRR